MKRTISESDWMKISMIEPKNMADEKIAEIDIFGRIGGDFWDDDEKSVNTKEKMRDELRAIAELKATKIIVNINSLGGSVDHGISIHDMLAQQDAMVITNIGGMTASIATVIGQAGKVRRMSDNALMLAHRASYGMLGHYNSKELAGAIDDLNKVDEKIINIYQKRSGKDKAQIEELIDAQNGMGKWISASEANDFGLVDEIFEPMKMAAHASKKDLKMFKLPIPANMKDESNGLQSVVDQIKSFISAAIGGNKEPVNTEPEPVDPEEPVIEPEPIDGLEPVNLQEEPTEIQEPVNETEIQALQNRINALESDLAKINAGATKVGGAMGREDDDQTVKDPIEQMLVNDLAALRSELGHN